VVASDVVAELERVEQARCAAISRGDWNALADLLLDDYVHTHSTGVVQDKPTYLKHVSSRPRTTTRPGVRVRVYGDAAVMNGRQVNTFAEADRPPVENQVLQVWVRTDRGWKLAAFQSTSPHE
jgi:ketosteroid isomerase-like protein